MNQSIKAIFLIITFFLQPIAHAEWSDITDQVTFTKSAPAFDRVNRVLYSIVSIHNRSGHAIYGPARLRVFNSSIPFSKPPPSGGDEIHIEIPGTISNNESKFLRVDFQLAKGSLDYSLALERDFVHVATTGSDTTGDGSEANPLGTIQYAINQANDGDTILVHDGRYVENINFLGKAIMVGSMFMQDGNPGHITNTIIDGNRRDSVVIFDHGEGADSRLAGFTITNGYANGGTFNTNAGGGIRVLSSTPRLEHLNVINNEAYLHGGGIYFDTLRRLSNHLVISKVIIKNNRARDGGGIHYRSDRGGNVHTIHSAIIGNHAYHNGGGIYLYHLGILENSIVLGNSANRSGGGAIIDWGTYSGQQSVHFINTSIVNNQAQNSGGGIEYIIQGGNFANTIVWNNQPDNVSRVPEWWDSGIVFNHSLISPLRPGTGNLDTDPLFVANPDPGPDSVWGTDDDYGDLRLHPDSPLIDQGDTSATNSITDYQGSERVYGNSVDIGAYEWHPE